MFLKIGKLITRGKQDYWKSVFETLIFFDVNEKIDKLHAKYFNIIIANYGIKPDQIAIKEIDSNTIYGLKNSNTEVYFILRNEILIPLWKI